MSFEEGFTAIGTRLKGRIGRPIIGSKVGYLTNGGGNFVAVVLYEKVGKVGIIPRPYLMTLGTSSPSTLLCNQVSPTSVSSVSPSKPVDSLQLHVSTGPE